MDPSLAWLSGFEHIERLGQRFQALDARDSQVQSPEARGRALTA